MVNQPQTKLAFTREKVRARREPEFFIAVAHMWSSLGIFDRLSDKIGPEVHDEMSVPAASE